VRLLFVLEASLLPTRMGLRFFNKIEISIGCALRRTIRSDPDSDQPFRLAVCGSFAGDACSSRICDFSHDFGRPLVFTNTEEQGTTQAAIALPGRISDFDYKLRPYRMHRAIARGPVSIKRNLADPVVTFGRHRGEMAQLRCLSHRQPSIDRPLRQRRRSALGSACVRPPVFHGLALPATVAALMLVFPDRAPRLAFAGSF
jgi:hypothetical protein